MFSIFEHIDDIYKKSKGVDDGVKMGQIYGAIKEYLVLTSIYPVIYKLADNSYTCGFLAMRHFGHDIVSPFEDETFQFRLPTGALVGDLGVFGRSLKEFYEGLDIQHGVWPNTNAGTGGPDSRAPFPDDSRKLDKTGTRAWAKDLNYVTSFKHEFKARYARSDLLLTAITKSMFAKIMSVLAMYNLINFNGNSRYNGDKNKGNLPFAQLRTIYGGDSFMEDGFYSMTPEVKPECAELYVRLYYYVLFYKKLFMEEEVGTRIINQVAALKRFALLPLQGSKFTPILKIFFLKNFNTNTGDNINISDPDLIAYINECNKLYNAESGSERNRFDKIIKEFIRDINQRYGLVKTNSVKGVLETQRNEEYPAIARMQSREEYHTDDFKTKRSVYNKPELLDGEDDPIGNLGAPSASNESVLPALTKATTLIKPPVDSTYKIEELLAAVYAFRSKLDKYTESITNRFNSADNTTGATPASAGVLNYFSNSVTGHIALLKNKLASRTSNLDRFRILKEYITTNSNDKVFNIPPEVILYRELVVNNMNLLYKIYIRIIANIRLYGIDNEWTDPLLRGTFLYYLDSVNTDLVTVNRLGKAPILDFSTLQSVMERHLDRTRELHNMLRGGIEENYAGKMERTIVLLINVHRTIFRDGGLVSSIHYEDDTGGKLGVKIYPTNDYSEYTHVSPTTGAGNQFIYDTNAIRYNDPVTLRDPRVGVIKGKPMSPDLEFELLSENFSPKNIYVLFESLLALMYKLFYERHGVWYGPMLDTFIESISHINVGRFDIVTDTTSELGGREVFKDDLPFSDKMIALYRTLYMFRIGKEVLFQNDISLLSDSYKSDMKKYLPMFLFLFKFIIKQAYLHVGMMSDGNVIEKNKLMRPGAGTVPRGGLKEVTGGAKPTTSDVREFIVNINEIIELVKEAKSMRSKATKGLSKNITGVKSKIVLGANMGDTPVMEYDNRKIDELINDLIEMRNLDDHIKLRTLLDKIRNKYGEDIFSIGLAPFDNTDAIDKFLSGYNAADSDIDKITNKGNLYTVDTDINFMKIDSYDLNLGGKESAVNFMAIMFGIDNDIIEETSRIVRDLTYLQKIDTSDIRGICDKLKRDKVYEQVKKYYADIYQIREKIVSEYGEQLVTYLKRAGDIHDDPAEEPPVEGPGEEQEEQEEEIVDEWFGFGPAGNRIINEHLGGVDDNPEAIEEEAAPAVEGFPNMGDISEALTKLLHRLAGSDLHDDYKRDIGEKINKILGLIDPDDDYDAREQYEYYRTHMVGNGLLPDENLLELIVANLKDEYSGHPTLYVTDPDLSKLANECIKYANTLFPECKFDGGFRLTPDGRYLISKLDTDKLKTWVKFKSWFYENYILGCIKSKDDNYAGHSELLEEISGEITRLLGLLNDNSSLGLKNKVEKAQSLSEKTDLLNEVRDAYNKQVYRGIPSSITGVGKNLGKIGSNLKDINSNLSDVRELFERLHNSNSSLLQSLSEALTGGEAKRNKALEYLTTTMEKCVETLDIVNQSSSTHYNALKRLLKKEQGVLERVKEKLEADNLDKAAIADVGEVDDEIIEHRDLGPIPAADINPHEDIQKTVISDMTRVELVRAVDNIYNEFSALDKQVLKQVDYPPMIALIDNVVKKIDERYNNILGKYIKDGGRDRDEYRRVDIESLGECKAFIGYMARGGANISMFPLKQNVNIFHKINFIFWENTTEKFFDVNEEHILCSLFYYLYSNDLEIPPYATNIPPIYRKDSSKDLFGDGFAHACANFAIGVMVCPHVLNHHRYYSTSHLFIDFGMNGDKTYSYKYKNFYQSFSDIMGDDGTIVDYGSLESYLRYLRTLFSDTKPIKRIFLDQLYALTHNSTYYKARHNLDNGPMYVLTGSFPTNKIAIAPSLQNLLRGNPDVQEFTGGSASGCQLLVNIGELLSKLPALDKKYATKTLVKYHDQLMNCGCHKLALLLKGLSKDITNKTLMALAFKRLSETTITRKSIRATKKAHKVMFPVGRMCSTDSNPFGNYSNEFIISKVGFVTPNTIGFLKSRSAKDKLSTLMNKTSYKQLLGAVSNHKLRVTIDGKSESRTHNNVLSHGLFAKANYLLQAFITNDGITVCSNPSNSPCMKSGDLVALVDVLHKMITSGADSRDINSIIDKIRLHNIKNSFGQVIQSLESCASFEGGFDDKTYLSGDFTTFCELGDIRVDDLKDEKYARAAALYKHLKKRYIPNPLTITLHFLINLVKDDYTSIGDFVKFYGKYNDIIGRLTKNYDGTRFTSVGASTRRPTSASGKNRGTTTSTGPTGKLFKRTHRYKPIYDSGLTDGDSGDGGKYFWKHCGDDIVDSNITARAKNAVKYATLIYKSLFKLYTSISEKPKYLDPAPYISDVYEIVGKEKNIAPTSIAVDLIPTFVNTYDRRNGSERNLPTNDIGTTTFLDRVPLGLHCNNLRDIFNLFNGTNSLMLENVIMFLLDDKLHSITIEDFPYLKSIIDKTTLSEIARPNLSINSISDYISSFGKLTKYLYELEFKSSFANAFPVFNSLASPKYYHDVSTETLGAVESTDYIRIDWSNSLKSCVAILTDVDKTLIGTNVFTKLVLDVNTLQYTINATTTDADSILGSNALPDNDSLISMLELNTNTKEMMKYLTRDEKLKKIYNLGNRGTGVEKLYIDNIVDIGIMPININSMMREIPLASLINGVYSFDKIIDWLIHGNASGNRLVTQPDGSKIKVPITIGRATKGHEGMPSVTASEQYISALSQVYKTPLDRYQVPYADRKLADDMHGHLPKNDSTMVYPRPRAMESGIDVVNGLPTGSSIYNIGLDYGFGVFEDPKFNRVIRKKVLMHEGKLYTYFIADDTIAEDRDILYNVCNSFMCMGHMDQTPYVTSYAIVDHDLSNPSIKDKSELMKKLSPQLSFGATINTTVAEPDGSYYENQCMYPIMRKDLHHGVDPNLRTPILAANIYSDLLLNLYNEEFKRRFAQTQTVSRNQNTIIKGVSALYQRS